MIVDELKNWNSYPFGSIWKRAFEFLASLTPTSPDGETMIDGDRLFARVLTYATKAPAEAKLEAHDRYIDIQSTLLGAEGLDWFPRTSLTSITSYDRNKDVTYYSYPRVVPAHVHVRPGTFVMLLPNDAHRPALQVKGEPGEVRKVVIKCDFQALLSEIATNGK